MNIDLNNIKVVIFDFDGTLAIHRDKDYLKHRNESEDKRLEYILYKSLENGIIRR